MKENNEQIMYLVPANVTAKYELFPGVGWKELISTLVALAISFALAGLLGIPQKTVYKEPTMILVTEDMEVTEEGLVVMKEPVISFPARIIMVIMVTAFTFCLVRKEPSVGLSPIDSIKRSINFSKNQQKYSYKYNSGSRQ